MMHWLWDSSWVKTAEPTIYLVLTWYRNSGMSKLAETSQPPFPFPPWKPPKEILSWVPGDSGMELLFPWLFQPPRESKTRGPWGWILQWWAQRLSEWQWQQKTWETNHLSYHGVSKVGETSWMEAALSCSQNLPPFGWKLHSPVPKFSHALGVETAQSCP